MPGILEAQKLVLVLAAFILMTSARKEALVLECVLCIYYLVQFKKSTNETQIQALIDLGCKVNTNYPTFVQELGLSIRPTDFRVQNINGITQDTYRIVVQVFLITNKANQVRFFEKTFLVANDCLKVGFRISFLTFSDSNVDFFYC